MPGSGGAATIENRWAAPPRRAVDKKCHRPRKVEMTQNRLLKPPPLASCLNGLAILHGRYTGRAHPRYQDPPARRGGAGISTDATNPVSQLSCAGIIVGPDNSRQKNPGRGGCPF